MSDEPQVRISKKQYDFLRKRNEILTALERAGVDNWAGHDFAFESMKENKTGYYNPDYQDV